MESWGDLAKQLWWEMTPQTNYHGSPYTFNKFDDSKFLTGEGFMAHGPGHYSADSLDVAEWYKSKGGDRVLKYNGNIFDTKKMPSLIGDIDYYKSLKKNNNIDRLNSIRNKLFDNINTYNNWLDTYDDIPLKDRTFDMKKDDIVNMIKSAKTRINALDNLDKYTIDLGGNLYKVNVPNENFMWKEGLPLSQQTPYIRDTWYNNNFDYGKLLHDLSIEHDLEGIRLPNDKKFWRVYNKSINHYGEIKPALRRIFNNQMQALDIPDQLKFLRRSENLDKLGEAMGGIKGIRANGRRDGGINVTFTGNNIRMANTPWQRLVNRIPTQTLGKMARKLYNTPGVKQAIKFSNRVATPLMILDGIGLNQPVGQGSDQPPIYPVNGKLEGYITNKY